MLISPSRAQEEETRARVTRAVQPARLSLHVPREKRRFVFVSLNALLFFVSSLCSARDDAEGNGETFKRQ